MFALWRSNAALEMDPREGKTSAIRSGSGAEAPLHNLGGLHTPKLAGSNFFEKFLVNVKVGVNVLYIIVLFEGFDKSNHLRSL